MEGEKMMNKANDEEMASCLRWQRFALKRLHVSAW